MSWDVVTLETSTLGNRSYVVLSDESGTLQAVAVDPPRDIDRVEEVLRDRDATLALVMETHRHADYVSGGLELARRHGVDYAMPPGDPEPEFAYVQAREGDVIEAAGIGLRAVATPGHTPHHTSYVVVVGGRDVAVLTGGSMLFGAVGRTDLIAEDLTEPLARDQWRSVRRLGSELDGEVQVLPTHGFGSFCSASSGADVDSSTVAREHEDNPALVQDEDPFVEEMLDGYDTYPAYYERMPRANAAGPAPIDLSPPPSLDAAGLRAAIEAGQWVVDIRPRDEYADAHLAGTLSFAVGEALPVYLPWLLPAGTPVVLVAPDEKSLEQAQREMARVGIDRPAAAVVGAVRELADAGAGTVTSFRRVSAQDLADRLREQPDQPVLDVRRPGEWEDGHLAVARHIALHDLLGRTDEVPDGTWVHCGSGLRSAVAVSILERAGRQAVSIDAAYDDIAELAQTVDADGQKVDA